MIYETRDLLGMHHRIQYRRRIQVGPCDGFILRDGGGEVDFNVRPGGYVGRRRNWPYIGGGRHEGCSFCNQNV